MPFQRELERRKIQNNTPQIAGVVLVLTKVGAGSTIQLSVVVEDAGDKLDIELIEDDLLGGAAP